MKPAVYCSYSKLSFSLEICFIISQDIALLIFKKKKISIFLSNYWAVEAELSWVSSSIPPHTFAPNIIPQSRVCFDSHFSARLVFHTTQFFIVKLTVWTLPTETPHLPSCFLEFLNPLSWSIAGISVCPWIFTHVLTLVYVLNSPRRLIFLSSPRLYLPFKYIL